jgi:NTE family protein
MKESKEDKKQMSDEELTNIEETAGKDEKKRTLGIAMGTGGFRMAFHAGFIDGLRELGVEVNQFVGTSTGALSAFLGAIGVPGYEWLDEFPPVWHFDILKPGFIENYIKEEIRKRLSLNRKSDEERKKVVYELLNTKLKLISAGFPDFETKVFKTFNSQADVLSKLLAATSIPYQTSFPKKMNDRYYMDGFFATLFPYELPIKFLETDVKISLRIVPPYLDLESPNINLYEFYPRKYSYNLLQGVLPVSWMIDEMYQDGYRQAMYSRIEKLLGVEWTEKRSGERIEKTRRSGEEAPRRRLDDEDAISESLDNRRTERNIGRKSRFSLVEESKSIGNEIFNIFSDRQPKRKRRKFNFFNDEDKNRNEDIDMDEDEDNEDIDENDRVKRRR